MEYFDYSRMIEYWKKNDEYLHEIDWHRDPDGLGNVCYNNAPVWFNKLIARFQKRAFMNVLKKVGKLTGLEVLEIGCGTGRWSRILKESGANLTGIDLQRKVIERNRTIIKGVEFICGDFLTHDLPENSYELIISVTVLQHLPYESQHSAIKKIYKLLKTGGKVILLENCKDVGPHVFGNSLQEWIRKFEENGFKCIFRQGYGYHLLLYSIMEFTNKVLNFFRGKRKKVYLSPDEYLGLIKNRGGYLKRIYWNLIIRPIVYLSYPLEYLFERFPDRFAKHACMLFQK